MKVVVSLKPPMLKLSIWVRYFLWAFDGTRFFFSYACQDETFIQIYFYIVIPHYFGFFVFTCSSGSGWIVTLSILVYV